MHVKQAVIRIIPLTLSLATLAYAEPRKLLIGSYSGELTTVEFDPDQGTLATLSTNTQTGRGSSWQTIVNSNGTKYVLSVSEVYDGRNDKISVFEVDSQSGFLTLVSNTASAQTLLGPCSIAVSNDASMVFSASFSGGVNSYSLDPVAGLISSQFLDQFQYKLEVPGPVPGRQDTAHPHQTVVDPTGKYLLVPDLGADLVRLYEIDVAARTTKEVNTVHTVPGSGPRHGAFNVHNGEGEKRFYYLLNELANTVNVFSVDYADGLKFTPVQNISTYPTGTTPALNPAPTAAEIAFSPDGKFMYTTNRSDKTFEEAELGPTEGGITTVSDSIVTWGVNSTDGKVTLKELTPVGGLTPRHFSIEPTNGDFLAVVTQGSNRLAIFPRDIETGALGKVPVASFKLRSGREPVCVNWLD